MKAVCFFYLELRFIYLYVRKVLNAQKTYSLRPMLSAERTYYIHFRSSFSTHSVL